MTKKEWLNYLPEHIREFYLNNGHITQDHITELHNSNHEWLWVKYFEISPIYKRKSLIGSDTYK